MSFLQIFDPQIKKTKAKTIDQLYYHAKHELLRDENYYNYVRKSQTLVEYSRIFVLGFFILFLCGLVNMIIMVIRTICISKKALFERYRKFLAKKGDAMNDRRFDVPDLVIFLFNLLSALAIIILVGSDFANILAHGSYLYSLLVFLSFFGCFTFFLNFSRKFRILRFSFFVYSIFYVVSFLGYYGSAKMWLSSERVVSKKIFGLYKSIHLSPEIDEMIYAKETLKLNVFKSKQDKADKISNDPKPD